MEKYILYGCGGFATEIVEYLQDRSIQLQACGSNLEVSDIIDASRGRYDEVCLALGYAPKLHSTVSTLEAAEDKMVLICLGDPTARHQKYQQFKKYGQKMGTLVHNTAWVASNAQIEEGSIICPFVFIGPNAQVSANCVVNVHGTVGHDVRLGMSTVVSPHADLNGGSGSGEVSFIGAGAIFNPGTSIGSYSKVAAGAVVSRSFGDGFLLTGNPANGRQMFKVTK